MLLRVFLSAAIVGFCVAGPLQGRATAPYDCSTEGNRVVWWGCNSVGYCSNGVFSRLDCGNGTVYNRQSQQCTPPSANVPYPCNLPPPDCSSYVDSPGHRVPLTQQDTYENRPVCSYYFSCSYGQFLGYQACANGTVYDEAEQVCEPPQNVPPPCGFATVEPNQGQRPYGQGQGVYGQGGQGQGIGQVPSQGQGNVYTGGSNQGNPYVGNNQNPYAGRNPNTGTDQNDPWVRQRF